MNKVILNSSNNNYITHVFHLADLHIRNLQRHKEYREVFNKFFDEVKIHDIENSVIYIGGDIAHAKTDMSPELIREVSWFLNECAKLKPTFIITGNHDANLRNESRLDVLTPIVENLNNPNLYYLRDTGVYQYNNLTFVVYSILDHKENWPSGYNIEGENKICLFHGPVNKSDTDIGYVVSSNSFTTDMFGGFHISMMGDIHRRQSLQEFSEEYMEIDESDLQIYLDKGWVLNQKLENTEDIPMESKITSNKFF